MRRAMIFLVLAFAVAPLAFGGLAPAFAPIALLGFFLFIVVFVVLMVVGIVRGRW
ncbi:DUF1328 domain-containing protein [Roseitranquillus sediminis]|uniref:DUF1328 domain-containing protein n=1 Tax=Roseitranquillus sediminis TaxID=2809051 RepID=UPI001D0C3F37|nr:DUF1328 domain-containing protein [Roseitranquillus sediminis]MBM9593492.1 DUF1328 domain-containing protein [Roseitranquillus sediminis]